MSGGGEEEEGIHLEAGSIVILFIIITLVVGMIAREINKQIGFPYTPLLIIFGALLGGFSVFGKITEVNEDVMKINPHSILILLLPLLIFESAYNAHTEVLTKNFWQVILLVGPGVLFQSFLLAFVIYSVLGYGGEGQLDMNFESCLVLGSILATTDPVAVVALLKELGAPLHIETLIEMESLFNDGVAMVFFQIFVKLAQGEKIAAGDAIGQFVLMAFGGPAVGLMFGIAALVLLKVLTRGTTLFITIVVLLAYTTFLVSEKFFEGKVSGLLALVVSGIVMNVQAKDYMTNKQKIAVGFILSYLQFVAETVLFFMSGIFIGKILIDGSDEGTADDQIEGADWWKLIVLYIALNISRFVMFMLLMWPLKHMGEGMSWKEAFVAIWGGLRGALAIALGLIIYADEPNPEGINQRTQNLILFHVCGIATLTLLFNGSTCGWFVETIQLVSNTEIKKKFKQNYLKQVKQEAQRQKEVLGSNSYFDMVEWKGVDQLINLKELETKQGWSEVTKFEAEFKHSQKKSNIPNATGGLFAQQKDTERGLKEESSQMKGNFKRLGTVTDKKLEQQNQEFKDEKYQKIRYDYLRIFMKQISHTKSKEWISKSAFQLIFDAAEECTERLKYPINMWHLLEENMASEKKLYYQHKMTTFPGLGKVINYMFHLNLEFIHETIYIFTTCINDTKTFIKDNENIHSRNARKTQDMNKIMSELDHDFYKAKDYMRKIKKNYFEILGKLEQRKAAVKIIMAQAKMVDEHINTCYIPEKEGNQIKNYLSGKIEKLQSIKTLVELTSQSEDKIQIFFKDTLDPHELQHIISNASALKFEKDEEILGFDEEALYVYFIAQGEIEEVIYPVDDEEQTKKSSIIFTQGQVVGLSNLVDPDEKSLITLIAKEQTNVVGLQLSELRESYFNNGSFEEFCLKKCLYQFLHLSQKNTDIWAKWGSKNIDEINFIAQESSCIRLAVDEPIRPEYGGYVYMGQIQTQDGELVIESYSLIPPGYYYIATEITTLLEFKKQRGQKQQLDLPKTKFAGQRGNNNEAMNNSVMIGGGYNRNRQKSNQMLPRVQNNTVYDNNTTQQQGINAHKKENDRERSFLINNPTYNQNAVIDTRNKQSQSYASNGVSQNSANKLQGNTEKAEPVKHKVHGNQNKFSRGIKSKKSKTSADHEENLRTDEEINTSVVNVRNNKCDGDNGEVNDMQESEMVKQIVIPQQSIRQNNQQSNAINVEDMEIQSMADNPVVYSQKQSEVQSYVDNNQDIQQQNVGIKRLQRKGSNQQNNVQVQGQTNGQSQHTNQGLRRRGSLDKEKVHIMQEFQKGNHEEGIVEVVNINDNNVDDSNQKSNIKGGTYDEKYNMEKEQYKIQEKLKK